jgi:hypothetical protein
MVSYRKGKAAVHVVEHVAWPQLLVCPIGAAQPSAEAGHSEHRNDRYPQTSRLRIVPPNGVGSERARRSWSFGRYPAAVPLGMLRSPPSDAR